MISWLKGRVQYLNTKSVILNVAGVGYEISMPESALRQLKYEEDTEIFVHQVIREDSHSLYGFLTDRELFLFRDLISVSGIGPKIGLAVLNDHAVDTIIQAVFTQQEAVFSSVSGIGAKSASRLILELKGKFKSIPAMPTVEANASINDAEVIQALMSLGYTQNKIIPVLQSLQSDTTEKRIREALQLLAG